MTTRTSFYWRFVGACGLAELIGIGTIGLVATALHRAIGEPDRLSDRWLVFLTMTAAGAIEGAALGYFQWRMLRLRLPRLRRGEWVGVTVALAMAGWAVGMARPVFGPASTSPPGAGPGPGMVLLLAAGAGAAAGALFGAAQWLVLRRHCPRAGRWIGVNVAGWAAAMAAIFLGASLPAADWPAWAIGTTGAAGGLAGGLLLGAITGLVARTLHPWVDEQRWSLRGRVCLVTGATSGIGHEVALGLARLGGTVVLLGRDHRRAEAARRAIAGAVPGADPQVIAVDLASSASVRLGAAEILRRWQRIHVLVHDAGATFPTRAVTDAGVERTLAVDVTGPFLLTALLRPALESGPARVITLAGLSGRKSQVVLDDLSFCRRPYHWLAANAQAQRARVLFTAALAVQAPALLALAVHPGAVRTRAQDQLPVGLRLLVDTVLRPGFMRAELGALPVLRLAAEPALDIASGSYLDRFEVVSPPADRELAAGLWEACARLTGVAPGGKADAAAVCGERDSPGASPHASRAL
jgi:retinol dehydrogenase-12